MSLQKRAILFVVFALVSPFLIAPVALADNYIDVSTPAQIHHEWGVQYLIDNSQSVDGKSQINGPRDNRGLALSPDKRYLYAGYNNPSSDGNGNTFQVRKIDTTVADYTDATVAVLYGYRGKAIATDDMGRVYLAETTKLTIYDANLATKLFEITSLSGTEGVAVTREVGALVMYTSDRTNKTLTRWVLTESGGGISAASKAGFAGTGVLTLSAVSGSSPRGVAVDASGRIWVADRGDNKVFRVGADGTGLTSVTVTNPMAIAFDDAQAFVTQYTDRTITVLEQESMLAVLGSPLTPPWTELELDPDGQSAGGALSGIAVGDGPFLYVANETGQTADNKSTYGRIDANSDSSYTDAIKDDNDPILLFVVNKTEPSFTFSTLPEKADGDADFSVASSVTTNSLGAVTFALGAGSVGCSVISGGVVTITGLAVNSDFCIIKAFLHESADYWDAGPISQSFHIAQATPTISINNIPGSAVYGGSFTPTYTYAGAGTTLVTSNTLSTCTVSGSVVTFVGAGTCTLVAHASAVTNYTAATGASQSFTISPQTTSVSISNIPSPAVYGGSFTPTYNYTGNGKTSVTSSTPSFCTVSSSGVVKFVGVGTDSCKLTAHATATINYTAVNGSEQPVTIGKANTTISINNMPPQGTYKKNSGFTATYVYIGDGVTSVTSSTMGVCTASGNKVTFLTSGTCTLTAHATESPKYKAANGSPQSVKITIKR